MMSLHSGRIPVGEVPVRSQEEEPEIPEPNTPAYAVVKFRKCAACEHLVPCRRSVNAGGVELCEAYWVGVINGVTVTL